MSNEMGTAEHPIESVADFLQALAVVERKPDRYVAFRGHGNTGWDVLPSIMRDKGNLLDREKDIIREVIARYPYDFDNDLTTFDRLSRLQHYGIATRLLDVSTNPLIALYFASEEQPDDFIEPDGCVITFTAPLARRKFYDSDTVSCIANLCSLSAEEKEILTTTKARTILEFNELKPAKRLIQFIRSEKPYFLPEIRREDLHTLFIVVPKLRNARIIAQHGAFMIFGLDRMSGPKYDRNINSRKIIISASHKKTIRWELESIGILDSTTFPEIDKASAHLMAKAKGIAR